jgi:hypothetical protein
MTSSFLKRLEKVEELMNPPAPPQMPRIVVTFIRPDGTVAGRRIFGPGESDGGRRIGPEEPDEVEEDETD